jgi:16S rRNA C1402 (ribose-2'-O) methylase RsmI
VWCWSRPRLPEFWIRMNTGTLWIVPHPTQPVDITCVRLTCCAVRGHCLRGHPHLRVLLRSHGNRTPMLSYHKFNERHAPRELLGRCKRARTWPC